MLKLSGKIVCAGENAPDKIRGEIFVLEDWKKFSPKNLPQRPLILVSKRLDVEIIHYFERNILGIIVAIRGILSHAWIITREMAEEDAPSHLIGVAGVSGAHKKLKNGDTVEIERIVYKGQE